MLYQIEENLCGLGIYQWSSDLYSERDLYFRPGLYEETFSWKFSPKFIRKKNSKASYHTIPVTKANLGLQLVFHEIVVFIRKLFHSQHGVSKIQRLQFYQVIPFFQYLYPNDHTRKDKKIQGIQEKKIHHSLCTSTSNPSSGNFSWLCRATNMVSSLNRCRSSLI